MRRFKDLTQNANLLNVLLLIIILSLGAGTTISIVRMRHYYSIPGIKAGTLPPARQPAEQAPKMPSDYAVIGEANLFHPDRTIPVDKKADVPRPEIVLYGTLIDTDRLAFIEDRKNPVSTPGRGNRQKVVRKGEVVSGYTVTDIMKDRITLARGDDRITVMLSEPKRRGDDTGTKPPVPAQPAKPGSPARPPQSPQAPARPAPAIAPPVQSPGRLPVGETPRPGLNRPATPQAGGQSSPRQTVPE